MMEHSMFFDGNGRFDDAKNTGAFTWSRADASRKFWEVVGFCEDVEVLRPSDLGR